MKLCALLVNEEVTFEANSHESYSGDHFGKIQTRDRGMSANPGPQNKFVLIGTTSVCNSSFRESGDFSDPKDTLKDCARQVLPLGTLRHNVVDADER